MFALQLHYISKIAEGASDIGGIAEVFPDRDTAFEKQGCVGKVATIAGIEGQRVQRDGNAVVIIQFDDRSRDFPRTVPSRKRNRPAGRLELPLRTTSARAVSDARRRLATRAAGP